MLDLNAVVQDKRISSVELDSVSASVRAMLALLDDLHAWVDDIPPLESATRFGNAAFRTWHRRLVDSVSELLHRVVSTCQLGDTEQQEKRDAVVEEVSAYLCKSFGDETRIDYGSGHEAMFLVAMYALHRAGVFSNEDREALVLRVFCRYLQVCRRVQLTYMLEPAGSHGVWGLDDYSFLPFLWGSSQLVSSTRIEPKVVNDDGALQEWRNEYVYLDAIAFIKEMKSGNFFEHSPMLNDISQVRGGWKKINQGMIKMYRAEVWGKRVVIQHFLFGDLFVFEQKN